MYCPVCRSEYRPGFERCEPCDAVLVAQLDDESRASADSESAWVPLCTLTSETEAALLEGYLESGGVECQIESLVFHAEPVNFAPLSELRLHVLRKDLAEAQKLLADVDSKAAPGETEPG